MNGGVVNFTDERRHSFLGSLIFLEEHHQIIRRVLRDNITLEQIQVRYLAHSQEVFILQALQALF